MSHYFFDSSALVKRYQMEDGSERVNSLLDKEQYLLISSVGIVEVCSVLNRLRNQKKMDQETMEFARKQFLYDVRTRFFVVGLEGYRIAIANNMVFSHNLTSFDAIQLASCVHIPGVPVDKTVFVSADRDLCDAAKEEGLQTLNVLE